MSNRTRTSRDIRRRAYSTFRIKKQDSASRIIEGIASTPTPDRMLDIVEPKGASFKLPLPLLWQHDPMQPVGRVLSAEVTDEGIKFKAQIETMDEPGRLKDRLDEAWQSVSKGLVRAVSIGFSSKEPPELLRNGGLRFLSWDWFELSLVTIPANEEATINTIKSLARQQRKAAGGRTSPSNRTAPGDSGKAKAAKGATTMAKSTEEKIDALIEEIESSKARMKEIMEEQEEDKELDEEEEKELDELEEEVAAKSKSLRRLKMLVGTADNDSHRGTLRRVEGDDLKKGLESRGGGKLPAQVKNEEPKGIGMARLVMCYARAKGNPMHAIEVAKQAYAGHPQLKQLETVLKAQVAGGNTTDPSWAAPLVEPQNLISEFVEYLRPQTIIGKFGTDGIPALRSVPFNIKVPAQISAGAGYWVGEGKAKPLTKFDFESITLLYNKVATIAVLSEELLRFSAPSAELMVRNALSEAVIAKLDTDIVDPAVTATADRPGSLTNGAQTYVASGVDADAVRADVGRLATFMITNNIPLNSVVLIMRNSQALKLSLMRNALGAKEFPDITMAGGFLEGFPVIASQYPSAGLVTAVAASEIYLADDGGVLIEMSREASLEMDNAPSHMINNGASPPVSVESAMVSMFQTNSVAIRAERVITWKRRRAAAVVYQTATGWGNLDTSPPQAAI